MTNILITGANGFVGSALMLKLAETEAGIIRIAVRKSTCTAPKRVEIFENLELSEKTDWSSA
jgi:nucleoside-diphosphate-sugar epimerase